MKFHTIWRVLMVAAGTGILIIVLPWDEIPMAIGVFAIAWGVSEC